MWRSAAIAVLAFASTNVDDIFVLMLLYAQASEKREKRRVTLGQYLGIAFLTGLSIVGAWGTRVLFSEYIWLLGIVPIFLGIRLWSSWGKKAEEERAPFSTGILGTAALTIANGADNIGVYVPVFSRCTVRELMMMVAVFGILTGMWCFAGCQLAGVRFIREGIGRHQRIIVPAALIGLGILLILRGVGA